MQFLLLQTPGLVQATVSGSGQSGGRGGEGGGGGGVCGQKREADMLLNPVPGRARPESRSLSAPLRGTRGTRPEGSSCGGRGLPTRDVQAQVHGARVLGRLFWHALYPPPASTPCLALRHVCCWWRHPGLGMIGAGQAPSSAPRSQEPPHGQRAARLGSEWQEAWGHTGVPGLPSTLLFLPLCHPERGSLLCPWARLQPGAAPGRCRAQDQPPNSCLLLTDCPPTSVSLQRGRVHGRPGQSGGDLRPAWARPNTAALFTSPHLP